MITLTGSRGFIGGYIKADENIDIKDGIDICDLKEIKGDIVIHLAAVSSIPKSVENPTETMRTNLYGLSNIIQLCKKKNARLIFASSCSVADPRSPYAYSKLWGERLIKQSGIDYTILRFGNVYGEGDDKSAIMHFQNDKIITIFGDGSVKRNFIYVRDVADIIMSVVNRYIKGTLNVGNENLTMLDVAGYFNKTITFEAGKDSDAPNLWFDSNFIAKTSIKDWIQK